MAQRFQVKLTIQHRDLGARKLGGKVKMIAKRQAPQVVTGILGSGKSDVATYAAANEFGTEDGHIPPRPFVRPSYSNRNVKAALRRLEGYLQDKVTLDDFLNQLGKATVNAIIANINRHPPPPNAPSTIARKGSSGTLVDTGRMKQSFSYEIRKPGSTKK